MSQETVPPAEPLHFHIKRANLQKRTMFVRCCGGSSLKQTSSSHTHPGLGRLMMCSPSQPQALLGLHRVGSRGQLAPPGPSWSWMCSSLILSPIGTHSYATYSSDCMAAARNRLMFHSDYAQAKSKKIYTNENNLCVQLSAALLETSS